MLRPLPRGAAAGAGRRCWRYELGAPAERVLTSDSGIVLVRGTHGDKPTTEVEVIPYDAL